MQDQRETMEGIIVLHSEAIPPNVNYGYVSFREGACKTSIKNMYPG